MAQQNTGYGASYPTTYGYGQDLSAGTYYQTPSGYSDYAATQAPAAGGYGNNTYGTSNYNMAGYSSGYSQENQLPVPKYQPLGSYGAVGEPLKPAASGYEAGQFASAPQESSWQGYSDYSSNTTQYDTSLGTYDSPSGFSAPDSYTQNNVAPSYGSDGSGRGFSSNRGSRPPRGGPGRGGMQSSWGSEGYDGTDGYSRGGPGRGMRGGSRGKFGAMRGTGRGQYDVGGENLGRGQFGGRGGRSQVDGGSRGRGQFSGGDRGRSGNRGGGQFERGSSRGRGQGGDVRGRGGNRGRGQFDGGNRGRGQFGSRGRGFGQEGNKSFGQDGTRGRGQGGMRGRGQDGFRGRGQGGTGGRGQDGAFGQRGGMRGRGQQEGTRGRGQVDRGRGRGNGITPSGQPGQYGVKIKKPFKMSRDAGFISYKNNLQEYCQKNHKPVPQYTIQKADIGFTATVQADGAMYSTLQSQREKKDAEQSAAFEALKAMGFIDQNEMFTAKLGSGKAKKRLGEDASSEPDSKVVKLEEEPALPTTQSCKSKLNEACMKMRCDLPTYSTIRANGGFLSTIVLNGQVFQGEQVYGQKKLAEQHVAEIVFAKLEGGLINLDSTNAVLDTSDSDVDLSNTAIANTTPKPAPKAKPMKNIVQEYCQKNGMQIPIYNTVKDAGMCIATVTVNGVDYVGTPHIMKKTAEQNAAKKVVEQLELK